MGAAIATMPLLEFGRTKIRDDTTNTAIAAKSGLPPAAAYPISRIFEQEERLALDTLTLGDRALLSQALVLPKVAASTPAGRRDRGKRCDCRAAKIGLIACSGTPAGADDPIGHCRFGIRRDELGVGSQILNQVGKTRPYQEPRSRISRTKGQRDPSGAATIDAGNHPAQAWFRPAVTSSCGPPSNGPGAC